MTVTPRSSLRPLWQEHRTHWTQSILTSTSGCCIKIIKRNAQLQTKTKLDNNTSINSSAILGSWTKGDCVTETIWALWSQRFQNVPFSPSTLKHLAVVFKFICSGERFQKVSFSVTKNVIWVWTKRPNGEKIGFSNLSGLVWTEPHYCSN